MTNWTTSDSTAIGQSHASLCDRLGDIPAIRAVIEDYTERQNLPMKNLRCIVVPLVLLCLSLSALAFEDEDTKFIDTYIASQAHRERGEEYRKGRQVATGDLNDDGTSDIAVLYTIEGQHGTNLHIQYLAVFVRTGGKLVAAARAEVGGKGTRSLELKATENNSIHLETLEYGPRDPSCCPSERGKTNYVLAGNELKEQKKGPP